MEILGLVDIPLWILLLLTIAIILYVYGTWAHDAWSSQGLRGPKPWPIVGNSVEVLHKTNFKVYAEWQEKYGPVVGHFIGVQPALAVNDIEMLKEIMVKQFNKFVDRNLVDGLRPPMIDSGLFFARGNKWKRIRHMMTPTFSTSKLKLMTHFIQRCSSLLSETVEIKARAGQMIDIKDMFGSFTMDVIAGTAFGLETNSQTEDGEPFVMHGKKLFSELSDNTFLRLFIIFVRSFPFLGPLLGKMGVGFLQSEHAIFLVDAMNKLIDERREEKDQDKSQKRVDLLQMLVEAEADAHSVTNFTGESDDTKSHKRMTKEEIVGQGFIILIAGFETTATTLQYLTYNLAKYPDVQEKVFQEIQDVLGDEEPSYQSVASLKYLDAAIQETLRLFPPVPTIDRIASEDLTVKDIQIPAGSSVVVPVFCIMHDPKNFPDPESFMPERFLESNREHMDHLLQELAFGYGPRQCVGMRLALLEIKFVAVNIFRKFRFLCCAETPEKISFTKANGITVSDEIIKVKAELRTD